MIIRFILGLICVLIFLYLYKKFKSKNLYKKHTIDLKKNKDGTYSPDE